MRPAAARAQRALQAFSIAQTLPDLPRWWQEFLKFYPPAHTAIGELAKVKPFGTDWLSPARYLQGGKRLVPKGIPVYKFRAEA